MTKNLSSKLMGGKAKVAGVFASIAAALLLLLTITPFALAANTNGNTAYVNANTDANIANQTIVGEGANNNVIITNTAQDAPDPTGILAANMPFIIVGAIVLAGVVVIVARARKSSKDGE